MLLIQGLAVEGWVQASYSIMQTALNDSENLEYWSRLIGPLVRRRYSLYSMSGEPVNLFTSTSDLVMLLLLYILTGPVFTENHAEELVPMLRAYANALREPETHLLARRISS